MSRFISITFFVLMVSVLASNAQDSLPKPNAFPKAAFGIKAGMNRSILSASVNSESSLRTGLVLGIYVRQQIGKAVFLRPELYYSGQGEKSTYITGRDVVVGSSETTLNYLNLPLLLEFGRKVSFQFGPQLGILLSAKEKGILNGGNFGNDLKDSMQSIDFGVVVGAGVFLGGHFNAGFRVNHGLSNVFNTSGNFGGITLPKVCNRAMHFYVACSF